jgi:hypothetical protein
MSVYAENKAFIVLRGAKQMALLAPNRLSPSSIVIGIIVSVVLS